MNLQWIFVPFYCGILEMSLKFDIRSAKLEFCCFSFALGVWINQYECSICPVWSSYTPTDRRKKTRKNYFKFIFLYMKINNKLQIIASVVAAALKLIAFWQYLWHLSEVFPFYRTFWCFNGISAAKRNPCRGIADACISIHSFQTPLRGRGN